MAAGGWWWLSPHHDVPPPAPSVPAPGEAREILITSDGKVFFENVPMTLPELEQRLIIEKALTPDFPLEVRGDAQASYQSVIDVLDLLGRLGLTRVGLATRPIVK
jgi:biopolymer transport protein ExbD